jgi:hypothetical protein
VKITIFLLLFSALRLQAADNCIKTCVLNADCGIGAQCIAERCSYKPAFCFSDRWSVNERGEYSDCGGYYCEQKTGLCRRQATDSGHCTSGYIFDGKDSCMPSVNCETNDSECLNLMEKWKQARWQWENLYPEPHLPLLSCIACQKHEECGANQMCWQGRCVNEAVFCGKTADGEEALMFKDLTIKSCGDYACDAVVGQCRSDCLSNRDCRQGYTCNKNRFCSK